MTKITEELVKPRSEFETNNPVLITLRLEREGRLTEEEGTRLLISHLAKIGSLRWKGNPKCQKQLGI